MKKIAAIGSFIADLWFAIRNAIIWIPILIRQQKNTENIEQS